MVSREHIHWPLVQKGRHGVIIGIVGFNSAISLGIRCSHAWGDSSRAVSIVQTVSCVSRARRTRGVRDLGLGGWLGWGKVEFAHPKVAISADSARLIMAYPRRARRVKRYGGVGAYLFSCSRVGGD